MTMPRARPWPRAHGATKAPVRVPAKACASLLRGALRELRRAGDDPVEPADDEPPLGHQQHALPVILQHLARRRLEPAEAAALDDRRLGRLAEIVEIGAGALRQPLDRDLGRRRFRSLMAATAENWRSGAAPPPGSSRGGIACRPYCRAPTAAVSGLRIIGGRRRRSARSPTAKWIAVDEIGVGARRRARRSTGCAARGMQLVPAHMRDLERRVGGLDRHHLAVDPAEPVDGLELAAALGHQLHADADAEKRPAAPDHRFARAPLPAPAPRRGRGGNRRRRRPRAARSRSARGDLLGSAGDDDAARRRRSRAAARSNAFAAERRLPEP